MTTSSPRRQFLGSLALIAAGTGISALAMRGLRVPFMPEPRHVPAIATHPSRRFSSEGDGAFLIGSYPEHLAWRAFTPEPILHVHGDFEITLDNVHRSAALEVDGPLSKLDERIEGLQRQVRGQAVNGQGALLQWRVPFDQQFRFAAIGDSGGDREFAWTLERAHQLGADFLLSLGDIYYQPGDNENVLRHLSNSPLPVYAAIGNHDIVRGWDQNLLHWFEKGVGPRNSTFKLGGIQFINLDTAADTVPWSAGQRGVLLRQIPELSQNPGIRDYVVFTHRPITDLRPPEQQPTDHSIENFGEGEWLRDELLARGARNILNGHIHASIEKDDQGLHTMIAGEGMAHLDIVKSRGDISWFDDPEQRVAKILIGDVAPGQPVLYHWEPLLMPIDAHCSKRLRSAMAREQGHFEEILAHLEGLCGTSL